MRRLKNNHAVRRFRRTVFMEKPMKMQVFEAHSPRLRYRRLRADDFSAVAAILHDEQTMYAWGHGFSYDEICDWIADMLRRYQEDGCGYFAAVDPETGALAALAGPLAEQLDDGSTAVGLGYIVRRDLWQQGYGTECAQTMLRYAFERLGAARVVALIQPDNAPSRRVAEKCGMRPAGETVKHYQGRDIPHIIYAAERPQP